MRTGLIDRLGWLGVGDTTPLLVVAALEDLQIAAEPASSSTDNPVHGLFTQYWEKDMSALIATRKG